MNNKATRAVARNFVSVFSCLLIALQPAVLQAQEIIIDPNGNVGFAAPSVQQTSRAPVVNIATPRAGGTSLNQYSDFNVGADGVVLNNSMNSSATTLAGNVAGNPNLSGGSAALIVNEVTSANSSSLRGGIEVAGQRAHVVVTNPNGLLCDGCSFINTTTGTLSTGSLIGANGSVPRLKVEGGTVTIGRNGLVGDGNVNLVGGRTIVDGPVTAADRITVTGGSHWFRLDNARDFRHSTDLADGFAVDATAFGAMNAGQIYIVGTQNGLGVRTRGAIQSTDGKVSVRSRGDATVRSIGAQNGVNIRADGAVLLERDVSSVTGTLRVDAGTDFNSLSTTGVFGGGTVIIRTPAGSLSYDGVVQSGGNIDLRAQDALTFSAYASAKYRFRFSANAIALADATIVAPRLDHLSPSTSFTIDQSAIFTDRSFTLKTGDFSLGEDVVIDHRNSSKSAPTVSVVASGDFINRGDLRTLPNLNLTYEGTLRNEETGVIIADDLDLSRPGKAIYNAGVIQGNNGLSIAAGTFENTQTGALIGGSIDVAASNATNDGLIQAENRIQIAAGLINGGTISSGGEISHAGDLENTGQIFGDTNVTLSTQEFTNRGQIVAGDRLDATAEAAVRNYGSIISFGDANFEASARLHNAGMILADQTLSLTSWGLLNISADSLVRAGSFDTNIVYLQNDGQMHIANDVILKDQLREFRNAGTFTSGGQIDLSGRDGTSKLVLEAGSNLVSGASAENGLVDGAQLQLDFAVATVEGNIVSGGVLNFATSGDLVVAGQLQSGAGEDVSLSANQITISADASLRAGDDVLLAAGSGVRNQGTVVANDQLVFSAATASFDNSGLADARQLVGTSFSGQFLNSGILQSQSSVVVNADDISSTGGLYSRGGEVSLTADNDVTIGGTLYAEGDLSVAGNYVTMGSDFAGQAATLQLSAARADLSGLLNLSGTGPNVWAVSEDYGQSGAVFAGGDVRVNAGTVALTPNAILSSRKQLAIASGSTATIQGNVLADGDISVFAQQAVLLRSDIIGRQNGDFESALGKVTNEGLVNVRDDLTFSGASFENAASGRVLATNLSVDSNGPLTNRGRMIAGDTITLQSDDQIWNDPNGRIEAVSLDMRSNQFQNNGEIDVYGLVSNQAGDFQNDGKIDADLSIAVKAQDFTNELTGEISSDGDLTVVASGNFLSGADASISVRNILVDANSAQVRGLVEADDLVSIDTDTFTTVFAGGRLYGGDIFVDAGAAINVHGGALVGSTDYRASRVALAAGTTLINDGHIRGRSVQLHAQDQIVNNQWVGGADQMAIRSFNSYISNTGSLGVGNNSHVGAFLDLRAHTDIVNLGSIKALGEGTIRAYAGRIYNSKKADQSYRIEADVISLHATNYLFNGGIAYGHKSLSLRAGTGYASNYGTLQGPNIDMISDGSRVNIMRQVTGTGDFSARGKSINVERGITATDNITLETTTEDVIVKGQLRSKHVVVTAGRNILANAGVFRGTDLIDLEANDVRRLSVPAVSVSKQTRSVSETTYMTVEQIAINIIVTTEFEGSYDDALAWAATQYGSSYWSNTVETDYYVDYKTSSRTLSTIGGPIHSLSLRLRTGSIGNFGSLTQASASASNSLTYHTYESANINATGRVQIIADQGDVALHGQVKTSGGNILVKAGGDLALGRVTLDTRHNLILDSGGRLRHYDEATLKAGDGYEYLSDDTFKTADWFAGDISQHIRIEADNIQVTGDHEVKGHRITLTAKTDITQLDHVLSASGITYTAGRDIKIRFDPQAWYERKGSANSSAGYDQNYMGYRGQVLASRGTDLTLHANRDVILESGKLWASRDINITAYRNVLSEPVFIENDLSDRRTYTGWSFRNGSDGYQGVLSGHNSRYVRLLEIRPYENVISAGRDINISALNAATFVGTRIASSNGDISISTYNNRLSLLAAPGHWGYNYSRTTSSGFIFKKRTTVTYNGLRDIYKPSAVHASNGDITLIGGREDSVRLPGNVRLAAITSIGADFRAQNIDWTSHRSDVSMLTFTEHQSATATRKSSRKLFGLIPFGSSSSKTNGVTQIATGNDLFADETINIRAPQGTLTIEGGSITAREINLEANRIDIRAAIDRARNSHNSRVDNMITITTLTWSNDTETATMPSISAPGGINFNSTEAVLIGRADGLNMNAALLEQLGGRNTTAALESIANSQERYRIATEVSSQGESFGEGGGREINTTTYELPTGPGFEYLQDLQNAGAVYTPFELRDDEFYEKTVQLNPAFNALLQAGIAYVTGGAGLGLTGSQQIIANTFIGSFAESAITGNPLDLEDTFKTALTQVVVADVSTLIKTEVFGGAFTYDPLTQPASDFFNFDAMALRFRDSLIDNAVANVVNGQNPFANIDQVVQGALVSEISAFAHKSIGDWAAANDIPEGSIPHTLAHAAAGCILVSAADGTCTAGALSGVASAQLAGAAGLTNEEKLELSAFVGSFAAFWGSEGLAESVTAGGQNSTSSITHNYLTHFEARDRAVAVGQLLRCERNQNCSDDEIASFRDEIARLDALDAQRDQALISACAADPDGATCLGLVNELAYATQLYKDLADPMGLGNAADALQLTYLTAPLLVESGDLNGVGSAMLKEQQEGIDLLNRFRGSFEIVNSARVQEQLVLLSADAIMGLTGAGLVRLTSGGVPTSINNQRFDIGTDRGIWTVDPAFRSADEAAGVLINGRYIKNPTAMNLSESVATSGKVRVDGQLANGQYMYVVDTNGNIIIGTRDGQRMPHPTLIGGLNPQVQAAGIVDIRGGKIYSVDNSSGHFKPGSGSLQNAQSAFDDLPSNSFHTNFQGYLPFDG